MSVETRLAKLGITLAPPVPPVAAFRPWLRAGDLIFLSGHIARRDGQPWAGKLGVNVTLQEGIAAARAVAIDLLGTLQDAVQDLNAVEGIVKLTVFVNSAPDFTQPHLVADGASVLLGEIFGSAHARTAICIAQAPFGACVEIDMVAQARAQEAGR